jgi:cytochrome P450
VEAEDTQRISDALNVMMRHSSGIRMLLPPFVRWLPIPAMSQVRGAVNDLTKLVYRIIQARRENIDVDSGDLLSMLMQARDQDQSQMSDRQLRDEVLTFLLAGHETTALALSWTWYLLSGHPQASHRLREELDRVLGRRLPTYADLPSLRYTEQVIKESLRMYPPAWSLAREVHTSFEIGGYVIPAGANLIMSQWIMQRNPTFFSQPENFDPDRWATPECQKLPRFAYFPFGGGARQCIGAGFAMMEAVLLLATIAREFELNLVDHHPVKAIPSFTLRPKQGIRMWLKRRSGLPA